MWHRQGLKITDCVLFQVISVEYPDHLSRQLLTIDGTSGVPRNFVRGVQQIQLRTEDRENGDLEVVAPSQGFWRQL